MARGLYVEAGIRAPLERVWQLTQQPALHQRWDLRFSSITYLPRPDPVEPQRFTYATRIGFGVAITGTGESLATHEAQGGTRTSSLRFWSAHPLSLIEEGSGYWKYVPQPGADTLRFFTWYDYRPRFGLLGRGADLVFRPLIGWATVWSFDRLRLWAEEDVAPELVRTCTLIYTLCRLVIVFVWLWHGLVPKLLLHNADELTMLRQAGVPAGALPWFGAAEVAVAAVGLLFWRWRGYLAATAVVMVLALAGVALRSPAYLGAAFNPVTLNVGVAALAVAGWWAWRYTAFAGRCLRRAPTRNGDSQS